MSDITPRTNEILIGHGSSEAILLADMASGRMPHGIILGGARGIGKATLAYRLARMLLSGAGSFDMKESDPIFRRVASGSHADLLVIEPVYDEKKEEYAREISVEQAREIAQFLAFTPAEGKWRVVIIDPVDALNKNGANAILKILEEPPPQTVLILVSHKPGILLPTIRSRCRMLKCKPLSGKDFVSVMAHIMPDMGEERVDMLGQLSENSPGVSAEYEAQGAIELSEKLMDLVGKLPKLDPLKLHAFADQLAGSKQHTNWRVLTRLMLFFLEGVTRQAAGAQHISDLEKVAALHPPAVWAMKWQQAQEQFLLAEERHLDYKQVIIAFFHSIANKEGFLIGNTAA